MMDLNTGKPVSKKKYTTTWDDSKHMFTLTVTDQETISQWRAGTSPRLQVRFEGTVADDAPTDHKVGNKWVLTLNNSLTPSNEVFNIPPKLDPVKKDTQKDPTISIDGKTALLGDEIYYRVTIDARQDNQAYKVWRLGMTDDYDDEYLKLDATNVEITGETGKDVTDKFNIQDKDGVLYAYAKLVDTEIPATGETVKGDPQPEDLKAYSESDEHDPLTRPAIDQTLLGHTYTVTMPMTVIKVTDGYTVKNKATQVLNKIRKDTNEVTNPLKPINPAKDVTVKVGGASANGKSIYKGRSFLYQLDSSILPANRAYPQVDKWDIVDSLDPAFDEYTGQWAVYATRDLLSGGEALASKGDRIAGSDFDSSKLGGDLFTLSAATVDGRNVVTIEATDRYRALVSDDSHEAGWRACIQCKRLAVTDRHENQFTEHYNGKDLESNVVWTRTPDHDPEHRRPEVGPQVRLAERRPRQFEGRFDRLRRHGDRVHHHEHEQDRPRHEAGRGVPHQGHQARGLHHRRRRRGRGPQVPGRLGHQGAQARRKRRGHRHAQGRHQDPHRPSQGHRHPVDRMSGRHVGPVR